MAPTVRTLLVNPGLRDDGLYDPVGVVQAVVVPARAVFPKGCLAMRMRDVLGPFFADADFEELFPVRGRPAVPPARLARCRCCSSRRA